MKHIMENMNTKFAYVFPGQASQYVGMCREFLEGYPPAEGMFEAASEILGVDLKNVCLEGPEDVLVQTKFTQPALYVHSCIADRFLTERGIIPDCAAGHSLGEISALASAGSISYEDGLRIVAERSRAMQEDCDNNPGTMAAVMGLDIKQVEEICEGIDGIVQPANFNSPIQIVVSGEIEAIELFMERAKDAGAKRVVKLAVGGAYHSPLMDSTPQRLSDLLERMEFRPPKFPVIANVTGEAYEADHQFADYLVRQIQSPVLWSPSVDYMLSSGIDTFIEVGPGKVLQGLIKRSAKGAKLLSFEKPDDYEQIRQALQLTD
ncbi:MAG: ACP S-malonyltransferase [candidate division Zixibacteria bacterium]|nr:ACP S-malonyltransferase [candidate division Zixibacteria bacterium]